MMKRTQIYLPKQLHLKLTKLAQDQEVSLAELIRDSAEELIKKMEKKKARQRETWRFFSDPPKDYQTPLSKSAVDLIREERAE